MKTENATGLRVASYVLIFSWNNKHLSFRPVWGDFGISACVLRLILLGESYFISTMLVKGLIQSKALYISTYPDGTWRVIVSSLLSNEPLFTLGGVVA